MVNYRLELGDEERRAIREIALTTPAVAKRRNTINIFCFVFGVLSTAATVYFYLNYYFDGSAVYMLVLAVLFFFLGLGGNKLLQRLSMKRAMKKNGRKLNSGVREYVFDEDGVTVSSEFGSSNAKWNGCSNKGTFEHYIYFQLYDGRLVLIDKNKISEAELDEFNRLSGNLM